MRLNSGSEVMWCFEVETDWSAHAQTNLDDPDQIQHKNHTFDMELAQQYLNVKGITLQLASKNKTQYTIWTYFNHAIIKL